MNRRDFLEKTGIFGGSLLLFRMPANSSSSSREDLETITVDNFQFFRAEDSNVRDYMKRFETEVVRHLARQAVIDGSIIVDTTIPAEGYYHETPELTETFYYLRALQSNYTEEVTPAIERLHEIYTHPVFGQIQGVPTKINPDNVLLPDEGPVTISPVADPVSIAMATRASHPSLWTIDKIMDATSEVMEETGEKEKGVSLVGFAYGVDETGKQAVGYWNPWATTLAMETTVLSRLKFTYRGISPKKMIEWNVDERVEEHGKRVVDAYNDLFGIYGNPRMKMDYVTPDNAERLLKDAPDALRVVNIGVDEFTARPKKLYYHWGIVEDGNGYKVIGFFADRIVATSDWRDRATRDDARRVAQK